MKSRPLILLLLLHLAGCEAMGIRLEHPLLMKLSDQDIEEAEDSLRRIDSSAEKFRGLLVIEAELERKAFHPSGDFRYTVAVLDVLVEYNGAPTAKTIEILSPSIKNGGVDLRSKVLYRIAAWPLEELGFLTWRGMVVEIPRVNADSPMRRPTRTHPVQQHR